MTDGAPVVRRATRRLVVAVLSGSGRTHEYPPEGFPESR